MRALIREKYRPYHDREILQAEADAAAAIGVDLAAVLMNVDNQRR